MVEPRGNKTRRDRTRKDVAKIYPFAVAALALNDDKNLHLIYRSLANFSGKEMFVIGSQNWFKGATNGINEIVPIKHFPDNHSFLEHIKKETNYTLVGVEQSNRSILTTQLKYYPDNPCFVLGNESFGLGDDILLHCDLIVEIPMEGPHPCGNVGVSGGIIMYDFISKQSS